jgi:iron complex transport system permease protein
LLLLFILLLISLLLGRYPRGGLLSPFIFLEDEFARMLVINLRMPRLIVALLLGMTLGASGMVLQMIFSNPLVEPGFLGVSQGAAFGASLSIIYLGNSAWMVQGSAALFACLGLLFSYLLAHRIRFGGWILRLILAGISVSALFTAGIGFLKYIADPLHELPEITFWLLGGLWGITWQKLTVILSPVIMGIAVIYSLRWRLNLLSLNDETIFSLGGLPGRERVVLLGAAVISTASVISVCGIVSWIGLIVPHLARRMFGVNTRFSLTGAMIIGALFTITCDDLARTALAGEIPLGILTSLIGASFFLVLMISKRRRVH